VRTLPTMMIRPLASFAPLFYERVWQHALVLLAGAIPASGTPRAPHEILRCRIKMRNRA
jgi:hypothetical protein